MTILAVCGPIGSDLEEFSGQCYSLLNKENTLLIHSADYNSMSSLLFAIQNARGDVIVYGPDIFLDDKLRAQFDIKVFLELDSDLCLGKFLISSLANKSNVEKYQEYYFNKIQPLNEKIRESAQHADLRRPQGRPSDKLIDLLVDKEEGTLKRCPLLSSSLSRNVFWKSVSQSQQPDHKEQTESSIVSANQ
ncbi:uridine/cytidine kinase [Legionella wadsworthii]|uniref:Uridine/cytidine kinase n=1 Tax=Legionella wadsworthii TaxID=28088 RepID=A0A378LV05_9GAMM|nr:uridine kinase [Legionella wadsworthii]STY31220.1 uridine/cytidine kinase [Legionella wadsworthii]